MRAQGVEPSRARAGDRRWRRSTTPAVRRALELGAGERAWLVRRVRYGDGEPLLVETFHVPERSAPTSAITTWR